MAEETPAERSESVEARRRARIRLLLLKAQLAADTGMGALRRIDDHPRRPWKLFEELAVAAVSSAVAAALTASAVAWAVIGKDADRYGEGESDVEGVERG